MICHVSDSAREASDEETLNLNLLQTTINKVAFMYPTAKTKLTYICTHEKELTIIRAIVSHLSSITQLYPSLDSRARLCFSFRCTWRLCISRDYDQVCT